MQQQQVQRSMATSFDSILKRVRTYMEQNGATNVEGRMNKVREVEQHLQAIQQVILNQEQRPENQSQGLEAARDACRSVAHCDYLQTIAEQAALRNLLDEMNIENLPETIRPKGIEIKGYVDDGRAQLKEIDNVVKELVKKVSHSLTHSLSY